MKTKYLLILIIINTLISLIALGFAYKAYTTSPDNYVYQMKLMKWFQDEDKTREDWVKKQMEANVKYINDKINANVEYTNNALKNR